MNLPIAPLAAAITAIAVAMGVVALPSAMLEGLVMGSGLPSVIAAAEPPLGMTARAAVALAAGGAMAVLAWLTCFVLFGTRAVTVGTRAAPQMANDAAAPVPVLRRADAHPDAPPRPPLLATRDLGRPFLEVNAADPVDLPELPRVAEPVEAPVAPIRILQSAEPVHAAPMPILAEAPVQARPLSILGEARAPVRAEPLPIVAMVPPAAIAPPVAEPVAPPIVAEKPVPAPAEPLPIRAETPAPAPALPIQRSAEDAGFVAAPRSLRIAPPMAPVEQALPIDLEQPLAAFDPSAIRHNPLPPPVPVAPLRRPAPLPAEGERFEVFELTPAVRPAPRPTAPFRPRTTSSPRRDADASVHALLERLERGVGTMAIPEPARPRGSERGLEEALVTLRNLARGNGAAA